MGYAIKICKGNNINEKTFEVPNKEELIDMGDDNEYRYLNIKALRQIARGKPIKFRFIADVQIGRCTFTLYKKDVNGVESLACHTVFAKYLHDHHGYSTYEGDTSVNFTV